MKRIFMIVIGSVMCLPSFAQYAKKQTLQQKKEAEKQVSNSGVYVRAGIGYAFANAGQTLTTYNEPFSGNGHSTNGNSFSSYDMKKVSFTAGMQAHIAAGYMFNKNLGAELGANIGMSTNKYSSVVTFPSADQTRSIEQDIKQYVTTPVFLLPSLVLQAGIKKLNVYSKGSIVLPLSVKPVTELFQKSTLNGTSEVNTIAVTTEMKTKFHPGFGGALGLSYKTSSHISIWVEGNLVSYSAYAKEEVLTRYEQDGVNYLSRISAANRTTTYNTKSGGNADPTYSLPMSNMGINAGVKLDL